MSRHLTPVFKMSMKNLNWRKELDLFFTAMVFLTRLPAPRWVVFEEHYLNECSRYFPLVGLLIGLVAAFAYALGATLFGPLLAIILSMALTVWMTGAFHEDGFADMCDGFGGGWEREQILHIMKDSRLGSYGALGLLLMVVTKFMALLTLEMQVSGNTSLSNGEYSAAVVVALLVAHPISRFFAITYIYSLDYVQDSSISKVESQTRRLTRDALFFAGASIAVVLLWLDVVTVFWISAALVVLYFVFSRYLLAKIGGYTGDCLGAAQQLSEVIIYVVLCTSLSL